MSSYASLTDATTYGLVSSALGLNLTAAQIQANLDANSDVADGYMGARYSLPLLAPIPLAIVRGVVHMARYDLLSLRGFDETNASDKNVINTRNEAIKMFEMIRNQAFHPHVIESPRPTNLGQPQYAAPMIVSNPQQGWIPAEGTPPNTNSGIG